jgi:N,N'-diacetyllegionaminate synthase
MVDAAKEAGADCIKFQTFRSENLVSRRAEKAQYQKKNTSPDGTQLEMLRKLELSYEDFCKLSGYCREAQLEFLSTAFDLESVDFLHGLGMKVWKIPSGEITNLPYLVRIAELKQRVILSTGMCEMKEIEAAVEVLRKYGTQDITLLHCTTEYPAPYEDVNLNAMAAMRNSFRLPVGYSDHTQGIEVAVAAAALGAAVIEKHFTLDKMMEGPDHKASLETAELKAMITSIRNIERAMGNGIKKTAASEIKNISVARKSIVAKTRIKQGEAFTEDNLTAKRPGNGISPMQWFQVLGLTAAKDYEEDEMIEL